MPFKSLSIYMGSTRPTAFDFLYYSTHSRICTNCIGDPFNLSLAHPSTHLLMISFSFLPFTPQSLLFLYYLLAKTELSSFERLYFLMLLFEENALSYRHFEVSLTGIVNSLQWKALLGICLDHRWLNCRFYFRFRFTFPKTLRGSIRSFWFPSQKSVKTLSSRSIDWIFHLFSTLMWQFSKKFTIFHIR